MQEPWTIAELAELAAETLAATDSAEPPSGPARANGRVRDVPNERLVRWYATVGLVDPPLSRRGRVATYGRRHLLQLVAVKRRQAEGRSLAEIQAELTGATDETLAAVARVPGIRLTPEAALAAPARFWTRQPTQLTPGADRDQLDTRPSASPVGRIVHGVRLAAGVTLLLEGADREPRPEDVGGIIDAARPLLEELARRRLLQMADGQATGASGELGDLAEEGGHGN
jgi:DNA-binding transcriptional MerR regulator